MNFAFPSWCVSEMHELVKQISTCFSVRHSTLAAFLLCTISYVALKFIIYVLIISSSSFFSMSLIHLITNCISYYVASLTAMASFAFIGLIVSRNQNPMKIEDITWPRGDKKVLFQCWKIFHAWLKLQVLEISSKVIWLCSIHSIHSLGKSKRRWLHTCGLSLATCRLGMQSPLVTCSLLIHVHF